MGLGLMFVLFYVLIFQTHKREFKFRCGCRRNGSHMTAGTQITHNEKEKVCVEKHQYLEMFKIHKIPKNKTDSDIVMKFVHIMWFSILQLSVILWVRKKSKTTPALL